MNQAEHWEKRHHDLAAQVEELQRRAHLTPDEQRRVRLLKKEKLLAKDRAFASRHDQ